MDNKWVITAGVIIIVVAVGGFLFINMNKPTTTTPNETAIPTAPVSESTTTPSAMSETEIAVEGNEFKFTPSSITVKQGEKVKLTFKNAGKYPHNFVIADLDVSTETIQPGEETTVEFTPEKTGEFRFICSVGDHEEQGMRGSLIIE